jgi:hypothetical protein
LLAVRAIVNLVAVPPIGKIRDWPAIAKGSECTQSQATASFGFTPLSNVYNTPAESAAAKPGLAFVTVFAPES